MASLWSKLLRALDRTVDQILGEPPPRNDGPDAATVDEAIRLIQGHVDGDRKSRLVKRMRVSDLSPERQAQLAAELAKLLRRGDRQ